MRIAEIAFLGLGALSLMWIVIIYVHGPWYRKPIGRFLVTLFLALLSVYVFPIVRIINGAPVSVSSLTFAIVFGILLAYGVIAFKKANKAATVEIDEWEQ